MGATPSCLLTCTAEIHFSLFCLCITRHHVFLHYAAVFGSSHRINKWSGLAHSDQDTLGHPKTRLTDLKRPLLIGLKRRLMLDVTTESASWLWKSQLLELRPNFSQTGGASPRSTVLLQMQIIKTQLEFASNHMGGKPIWRNPL